jgi:hypothetical protein
MGIKRKGFVVRNKGVFFGFVVVDRKITKEGAELIEARVQRESELDLARLGDILKKDVWYEKDWTVVMESLGDLYTHPGRPVEKGDLGGNSTIALPIFLPDTSRNVFLEVWKILKDFNGNQSVSTFVAAIDSLVALSGRENDSFERGFLDAINDLVAQTAKIIARVPRVVPFGKSELDMLGPE